MKVPKKLTVRVPEVEVPVIKTKVPEVKVPKIPDVKVPEIPEVKIPETPKLNSTLVFESN